MYILFLVTSKVFNQTFFYDPFQCQHDNKTRRSLTTVIRYTFHSRVKTKFSFVFRLLKTFANGVVGFFFLFYVTIIVYRGVLFYFIVFF